MLGPWACWYGIAIERCVVDLYLCDCIFNTIALRAPWGRKRGVGVGDGIGIHG